MPTDPISIDPHFSSPPSLATTTKIDTTQSHSPTSPTSLFQGGRLNSSNLPPTFSSSPTNSSSSGSTASTPFAASPIANRRGSGALGYFAFSPVVVDSTTASGIGGSPTRPHGSAGRWSFSAGTGAQVFAPKGLQDLKELTLDDSNPFVSSREFNMSTSTTTTSVPSPPRRQSFAGLAIPPPPPPTLATSPPYISAMTMASGTGVGNSFLSATLPLSRTMSGGTGTGTAVGGVSAVEDKNARGRGVLRRLSLSGMVGSGAFRPNFMRSPAPTAQPSNTDPFSPASSHTPLTPPTTAIGSGPANNHARSISFGDPFSQAIHEHDEHDHDDHGIYQTQQKIPPGTVKTVGFAPVPQDEGRRVSAPVPDAKSREPAPGSLGHLFTRHSVSTTTAPPPPPPTRAEAMPIHVTEDGEIKRGGRPRRMSENAGHKKRGVSPMGEHILRGIQHF